MEEKEKNPLQNGGQDGMGDAEFSDTGTPGAADGLPEIEPIEVGGTPVELEPEEVLPYEEEDESKTPRGGRFKNLVRKVLTWILVFGLIYLAGVVTLYFLRVKPAEDALQQTQTELVDANETITQLQSDLDEAQFNLSYNTFLQVKTDIYVAQLALRDEDTSGAKIALGRVEDNLNLILEEIAAFDQSLANVLVQRLDLLVTNVDSDIETALVDAGIFTENLEKVYQGVYAGE